MQKLLVKKILENALNYDWTIQGFGMLRTYLDEEVRLHIWDSRYRITNVSIVHNHPWNFVSHIVAGEICNYHYNIAEEDPKGCYAEPYYAEEIVTGEDATAVEQNKTRKIWLCHQLSPETYKEGQIYTQHKDHLHRTDYADGTVTVIDRNSRSDNNHAISCWPRVLGEQGWVSAAPKIALDSVVEDIVSRSLHRWF